MKNLSDFISESLNESKVIVKGDDGMYHPKNRLELFELIQILIRERGLDADLNDIDTSEITDMSELFRHSNFNGDISKWDVSKVTDMSGMFEMSSFNGDISKWDVSSVEDMRCMFNDSLFNGNISKWDVSSVCDIRGMFSYSKFNGDINQWKLKRFVKMTNSYKKKQPKDGVFYKSPLENNPPVWYKG